jgi:hypothetical protein
MRPRRPRRDGAHHIEGDGGEVVATRELHKSLPPRECQNSTEKDGYREAFPRYFPFLEKATKLSGWTSSALAPGVALHMSEQNQGQGGGAEVLDEGPRFTTGPAGC